MKLLVVAVVCGLWTPLRAQSQPVFAGASPDGTASVWYAGDGALWLLTSSRELRLPGASDPRFDAFGRLYFDRVRDDGYRVIERVSCWLDPQGRSGRVHPLAHAAGAVRSGVSRAPLNALPGADRAVGPAVRVCIDPGHGGSDPGALGNGLREADINLDVCLRLAALCDLDTRDVAGGGEWDVLLTRTTDATVTLAQRTGMANAFGAESFLSVHMNAFTSPAANGTETFCFLGLGQSPAGLLRNRVQAEALSAWELTDRGVKEANFFVLRNTTMPAALLEGGFITNPVDSAKMADPLARQALARHLLFALQEHHGFAAYDPKQGPQTGSRPVPSASVSTGAP